MKPKSSSYARRSLTFEKLPYAGKTFYIDVKSASAKSKITQRILCLGGQIENFLSKDLSLLITDKTSTQHARGDCAQKQAVGSVPLSRGQALLLKASANQNCDTNNNSNHGMLQSASKLGIQIETPAGFLRQSSKLVEKVKAARPASRQEDCLSGMSTISWDSDKESCPVIKVEDVDGLYRPLFKQFDTFPHISYNETGCPFDVGVVLTKAKESNQSKKKSVVGALRGGYCESCDHWYKCTLREHLKSEKHKEFISVAENFRSLNQVSSNMPNLRNFVGKYGLKDISSPEILSDTLNLNNDYAKCDSVNQNVQSRLFAAFEEGTSEVYKSMPCYKDSYSASKQTGRHRHDSKTEPVFKSKQEENNPNTQPVRFIEVNHSVPQYQKPNEISSTDLQTKSALDEDQSERNELISENDATRTKSSMLNRMGRKFSVDDVIKSVTENEDYYSSDKNYTGKDFMSKTSVIITRHLSSDTSTNVCSNLSDCMDMNKGNGKENRPMDSSTGVLQKEIKEGAMRFRNLPAMYFSSSSCSFGDNGVGNVISFLNSQHSRKSYDKDDQASGKLLVENDSVVDGSCKSSSSWALEMLTETKDDSENVPKDNGNKFEILNDKFSVKESDMPVLEAMDESEERGPDLDLMPVLESYDSEDLNKFCTSILNDDKVSNSNVLTNIGLPEYSNITEESLQGKPHVESKHTLEQNLKTNFEVPVLDFSSNIFQGIDPVETPDKNHMKSLKSNIYENHANSGSTIRNWLLPNDDVASVRSVHSPGNLDATLVNTSVNVGEESHVRGLKEGNDDNQKDLCLSNIKETVDRSKVADWIQKQDFVVTASICENTRQGFLDDIEDDTESVNNKGNENYENESNHFKDLKSCSERRFSCENEKFEAGSNVWSDSGTSISDCTLDNFRIGGGQYNGADENVDGKETEKGIDPGILTHDEMSQDSGISAKTGLTSVVTARGIKISGLSSLSSHFFNAAESDHFTDSSNAISNNDRRNSEYSDIIRVNQMCSDPQLRVSHCERALNNNQILIDNNQNNGNDNRFTEKCNTPQSLNLSTSLNKSLNTEANVKKTAVQGKTNPRATKSNSGANNKRQTKPKKLGTSTNTKSKRQTQTQNLLTQVLSSSLYSPVSSAFENSSSQNDFTDLDTSATSQTIPYCHNQEQGNGTSAHVHKPPAFAHVHQNQFGIIGQNNGHNMNSQEYSYNAGYGMMDLLLSPSQQVNTSFYQTGFQQGQDNLQYVNPLTHQNNLSVKGPFMTHPNFNHQFGVLPFPQVYQNHTGSQNFTDNSHHFLCSDSNFLMHNLQAGSSIKKHNQTAGQAPENHLNYPVSQGFLSHDHKSLNGSLQTIEMSDIADNSGGSESNFNFKIADTNKLKKTVSRKPVRQKVLKENSTILRENSQQNIYNNDFERTGAYNSVQINSKNVYNGSNKDSQISNFQSVPYNNSPYTSSTINRPSENLRPYSSSIQANHVFQNSHQQQHMLVNCNRSQNMPGHSQNYVASSHHGHADHDWNMYNTVLTGDTKVTFRRMPASNLAPSSKQSKHDLMQYWNVRKAGDCRLVFSANAPTGKRKAEEETPSKSVYMSHSNEMENSQPLSKRRKCLVY